MAYTVLARKYRPLRFSDVVGQDHVTRTLLNALAQNRIAHGYIFSGHRGIGKTTIARILASALNCRNAIGSELRPTPEPCNICESCLEIRQGNAVDVIEIDAATNRGIDEIRELRDAARYRPSRDKYKIFILDEAHQITDAAFNALLKTLEEPPEHIVFMMATTQPEDIPQTIRSRCQHFSFHAVKLDDIVGQLRKISVDEGIRTDDTTLSLLAEAGDGSMRDALSIMDQAIASAPLVPAAPGEPAGHPLLEAEPVRELMGSVSNVVYEQVLEAVNANSSADVLTVVGHLLDAGNGPQQIARQFVRYLRNCVMAKITGLTPEADATGNAADLLQIPPEERKRVARSAALFTEEELSRFLAIVLRTFDDLGYRQEPRFHLELGLLKLVHVQRLLPVEELLSQFGIAPSPNLKPRPDALAAAKTQAPPPPAPTVSYPAKVGTNRAAPTGVPSQARSFTARQGGVATSERDTVAGASTPPGVPGTVPSPPLTSPKSAPAPSSGAIDGSLALAPAQALAPEPERPRLVPSPSPAAPPAAVPELAALELTALQAAAVAALEAAKGQQSAADALAGGKFSLIGEVLEIETGLSKAMLPVLFNAEAERLIRSALRDHGAGHLRLKLSPGAPSVANAPRQPRAVRAGSAAERAENHPVVQEAKRLFSAELSNVIDLRDKT